MARMNLRMFEAAIESIRSQNWDALWDDSFLWGGKRIRKLMDYDGEAHYPRDAAAESVMEAFVNSIFSGCS